MIVPMFPLQTALLPGDTIPLRIFEPRYTRLVRDCLDAAVPEFGTVLISRGSEVGGDDARNDVGVLARIVDRVDLGDGQYEVLAQAGDRLRVRSWLPDMPYPRAMVELWPDEPGLGPDEPGLGSDEPGLGPVADAVRALHQRLAGIDGPGRGGDALVVDSATAADPGRHLYALAARVPMGQADRYAVLAAPTLSARIGVLLDAIATVTAMVDFQLSGD